MGLWNFLHFADRTTFKGGGGGGGGGGVQGKFFWRIKFELWAPQVPLIIGGTFGEVLEPRRPTVSEPRPAQKLGVK